MARRSYNVQTYEDALLVRRERMQAGLTLDQLAERIGTSTQHLQRMETGERNISLEWLKKIGAALDVPLARLVPGGDGLSEEERELIDWLRTHARDRSLIMSQFRAMRDSRADYMDAG